MTKIQKVELLENTVDDNKKHRIIQIGVRERHVRRSVGYGRVTRGCGGGGGGGGGDHVSGLHYYYYTCQTSRLTHIRGGLITSRRTIRLPLVFFLPPVAVIPVW